MTSAETAAAALPPNSDNPDEPLTHRQILTILSGLMMGMFLAALDQTIIASAMRTIADDLHNLEGQAWATTAYLITSTIVTPLYGKLSDIYGRKPFFTAAIVIFIGGSLLCSFATSMPQLAVFRALQGLGAGGLFSLALAIIGDIVPARERARYQGYFLAVFGTSSVLGPVIGGFFAGADSILGITGWRWVFLINVPLGVVALVVVSRTLHLRHTRLDHRIDVLGALALVVALMPLLLVAEQGRTWGWTSGYSLLCVAIGIIGILAFVWVENAMGDEALLPLRLFREKTVGVASVAGVMLGIGMFGGLASIPLFLQIVKGYSPTAAGLMMVPMTLGLMAGSLLTGRTISKTGRYRHWPIIGTGLIAMARFALSFLHYDTPRWQALIVLLFFGFGLGLNLQTLTLAVQNAVPPRDIGVATASATFTRQIGGTIGTAVFLSVLFSAVPQRIADAMSTSGPGNADFMAALRDPQGDAQANHAFIQGLKAAQSGAAAAVNPLQDSSFLQLIDPRLAKPFLVGFSGAMDLVFLMGAVVMAVAFVWILQLPHVELRTTSAYQQRRDDAGGVGASAGLGASAGPGSAAAAGEGPQGRAKPDPPSQTGAPRPTDGVTELTRAAKPGPWDP
ncbi:MAG: MDR family MFS transporter, partial [Micrococcales bacterium]|nr:MDR family MFS transporter [Micrococcales bacterium]